MHNDCPLAPEKLAIPYDMLLNYCEKIAGKYGIKVSKVKKLVPNLSNKTNYVVHYRNLQSYLSLGMELTKTQKILKFKQSDWSKKYIVFNTKKRKNAANNFEKYFFVYGKTTKNLRKRISIRLVNNERNYLKHVSKTTFISQKIFDKQFAAIHEIETVVKLNKPIYVGFSILELSKWLIYDFHYNFIKKNFDANLLFTDTDSLTYEIKSEDIYEEFFNHKHLFDFSKYQSKFFHPTNKLYSF